MGEKRIVRVVRYLTVGAITLCAVLSAHTASAFPAAPTSGGTTLVSERFTGATADSRFHGFGSACLTGAARGPALRLGEGHTLRGCGTMVEGAVPPGAEAPYGYLQLTDASKDQAGAVLFESPIPATDGLEVTFQQWQYGGATPKPIGPGIVHADGISFFLSDGSRLSSCMRITWLTGGRRWVHERCVAVAGFWSPGARGGDRGRAGGVRRGGRRDAR